jgi:hypothetical protein
MLVAIQWQFNNKSPTLQGTCTPDRSSDSLDGGCDVTEEPQRAPIARGEPGEANAGLVRDALAVLDANWLGHATRPGRLYPHQWSWDAACIAMGRAARQQDRAEQELRSLFSGQWRNGLLPHIVFGDADRYFPGPAFWQTERSADAPRSPRTSGIVQPPIHATGVWRLFCGAPDRPRAAAFLKEMLPKLTRWHEYLYRERARDESGLVEIWHPWESGMDNAPVWDEALARIRLAAADVPEYRRVDDTIAPAGERPSDFQYDRYTYLVKLFLDRAYDSARIRDDSPFVMQPVLFNSLLIRSNRDLARIAREVGADPTPYETWADVTAAGMERLWDGARGVYVDYDVRAAAKVSAWNASGFAPLYGGVPSADRGARMIDGLERTGRTLGPGLWAVPAVAADDPEFEPARYWRGPVWPIIQWLLSQGAAAYGYTDLSERLRRTAIELARRGGFWEHYNPLTGAGQGEPSFAWTAGLVLDLLLGPPAGGDGQA